MEIHGISNMSVIGIVFADTRPDNKTQKALKNVSSNLYMNINLMPVFQFFNDPPLSTATYRNTIRAYTDY